jgi:hypothetical protein
MITRGAASAPSTPGDRRAAKAEILCSFETTNTKIRGVHDSPEQDDPVTYINFETTAQEDESWERYNTRYDCTQLGHAVAITYTWSSRTNFVYSV